MNEPRRVKGKDFFSNALKILRESFSIFSQIKAAEVTKGEIKITLERPAQLERLVDELRNLIILVENLDINLIEKLEDRIDEAKKELAEKSDEASDKE